MASEKKVPIDPQVRIGHVHLKVADLERAIGFYRDVLGLTLKFQSPGWTEFSTGETSLGLHPSSEKSPAGSVELGFIVADLDRFHQDMSAKGVQLACFRQSRISEVRLHNS